MKRRRSTIFATLSLLLFVAVVALWIRSYIVSEHVARPARDGGAYAVRSGEGRLYVGRYAHWDIGGGWVRFDLRPTYPGERRGSAATMDRAAASERLELLGFATYAGTHYTWPQYLYPDVTQTRRGATRGG